ncbi:MAG: hypothetical protein HY665_05760 [Chloroflexi bacterium]|nr:hypothetical protein [Chloroflexota bacterium]
MTERNGYAGKILRVDLSSGKITCMPTMDYADRFVGGRGIAARVYWDEVSPEVKTFDPENLLMFMTGPLAGISGVAAPRWEISGKSAIAAPEQFCHCSVAGRWGVQLKYAGYDGIVIGGRSDKPVYLFIQDGVAEIRDASSLWGKTAFETREILKEELGSTVAVAACGPAGENLVVHAIVLADNDATGASGFGAVMGSKKLKAIAVRGRGKVTAADPDKVRQLANHIRQLHEGVDLLPEIGLIPGPQMKRDVCQGCGVGCWRATFEATDGQKGKYMCGSGLFYQGYARKYYGEWNEVPFRANRLCDAYGLDITALLPTIYWLAKCHREGILDDENTGIPLSKLGSLEFIETLVKKISLRDGFGDALARGVLRAADLVGGQAKEFAGEYVMKAEFFAPQDPRLYITTGLLYAMEPRPLISQYSEALHVVCAWLSWVKKHEHAYVSSEALRGIAERFWGSELAVDHSTYEGKALAAVKIQNRGFIRESLILCSYVWPITVVKNSEDHIGDPTLESKVFSAVTGKEIDEEGLYGIGEAIFNLQRAIHAREGLRGREADVLSEESYTKPAKVVAPYNPECIVPGKGGEVISRRNAVLDLEKFEQMKDEFYRLRGWDVATGLQTKTKLRELGLGDMVADLERRGLVV